MTTPIDSLATVVAELRELSSPSGYVAELNVIDLCDRIERLDAEMRKESGWCPDAVTRWKGVVEMRDLEIADLRARLAAFTDPLNGFTLADAALRTIVYDMGAFGTMLNNLSETDRLELRAGIAQAIERAALATRASVPEDAAK